MCEYHGSYDFYQNKTSDCKLGYLTVMYPIYLVFGATRRYFYTELLKQIKSNSWKTEYKTFWWITAETKPMANTAVALKHKKNLWNLDYTGRWNNRIMAFIW